MNPESRKRRQRYMKELRGRTFSAVYIDEFSDELSYFSPPTEVDDRDIEEEQKKVAAFYSDLECFV